MHQNKHIPPRITQQKGKREKPFCFISMTKDESLQTTRVVCKVIQNLSLGTLLLNGIKLTALQHKVREGWRGLVDAHRPQESRGGRLPCFPGGEGSRLSEPARPPTTGQRSQSCQEQAAARPVKAPVGICHPWTWPK